ncbi:MAG: helix-turn-helix transcriptional regulator, partial [Actinomycetota bacterium]|nr:helix-turn-helix transcriptional regulator [Actinomycetota bacterium]
LEVARQAVRRGAVSSARTALDRAARLARPRAELSVLVEEAQAHAAALAGDVDEAIRRAAVVLGALPPGEAALDRRARLHLTLARASLVAGRHDDAARHVTDALMLSTKATGADPALPATAEALAAHVAMADGRTEEAAALASSALERARHATAPAAACEALEVLGRIARSTDLAEAEHLFLDALAIASEHDLALWRARALHELGTIDLYTGRRSERFQAAREAAVEAGAVATIALCDLHLAVGGYAHWDLEGAVIAGRRCVDLSRRLGLNTLGMGLVHLATSLGLAGKLDEMEAVLAEASAFASDEVDVAAGIPGRARMALAVRRADIEGMRRALDEAMAVILRHPQIHFPYRGLWALVHTVEDPSGDGGARVRAEAHAPGGTGALFNDLCLELAQAVAMGREGHDEEATAAVNESAIERDITGAGEGWESLVLALVASAALRGGWGQGERWARMALADFDDRGMNELASWCRSMLRDAGRPVPRRGRGESSPPADLRALGVTSRESDVLAALASGATNNEIAARLHLSPRTVERHISNLLAKTGAADRHALARLSEAASAPM